MKSLGTTVACAECGKTLRGIIRVLDGYTVRRHRNETTGRPCAGQNRTDHRPAEARS